jgi:hypothetical protein
VPIPAFLSNPDDDLFTEPDLDNELISFQGVIPTRWKVSAKWATKRHNCTLDGVLKTCHGRCCTSKKYWPASSGSSPYGCEWLGDKGCSLEFQDRPVGCLIYPFLLNKNGTLVLHHRVTTKVTVCADNHGRGPIIIDALKDQFVSIFGEEQYNKLRNDVMNGRDGHLEVSEQLAAQVLREQWWEDNNIVPIPRSGANVQKPSESIRYAHGLYSIGTSRLKDANSSSNQ